MMRVKARRRSQLGMKRGSPAKGRSPFKRRSPRKLALDSEQVTEDTASNEASSVPVQANIRVAVRVRPENERELASAYRNVIDVVDDRMLVFDPKEDTDDFFYHGQKQQRRDLNKKVNRDQKFAFDCVFAPSASNQDVYEGTTKDLVDVIFQGYNCSVFVYGATGAGKTHTMLGSVENPGIIFRTVMELYSRIDSAKEESDIEVVISYLEIYNETVIDLINPSTRLDIREDGKGVNIPGLSRHRPSGPDDLLRLLQYGNGNRTQHPTDANKESSRSHAVFQVYIKQTGKASGLSADVKVAKLSMIDLAGSERGSATSSRGMARFREGANINKSLLALGNCINALAEGSKYIPYRNSKLTRLLKDSIGGNCRTVMISNVSASSMTYEDTYNTLRYADRAKKIKIKLKKNVLSVDFQVGQYAKIVEDLKVQLSECKARVAALEDENTELKNQLENVELKNQVVEETQPEVEEQVNQSKQEISQNLEELEMLKAQLVELQHRQKDYDDLQERLKEFETKQRLEKLDEVNRETLKIKDKKLEDDIKNYIEVTKRYQQMETSIRQLKVKKETYQQTIKRARVLTPEEWLYDSEKKFQKMIEDLDTKILRLVKKQNAIGQSLEIIKNEVPMEDEQFQEKLKIAKGQVQLEHALKISEMLFHENSRTEELLTESLGQLKKLFMCSYSNFKDTETEKSFKDLLSKVSCSVVQFRENKIIETNEETPYDRLGNFFGNIANLNNPTQELVNASYNIQENVNATLNESFDDKINETSADKSELIVTIMQDNEDEEDDDEEVLEPSPVEYRPPTPPKASPKTKDVEIPKTLPKLLFENSQEIGPSPKLVMQNKRGYFYAISQKEKLSPRLTPKSTEKVDLLPKTAPMVTPTLFMPVTEDLESHTPTPPQLSTIESRRLFKPVVADLDTTYDLNSKDNDADVYENEDKENLPNESFNVVESKVMDSTIVISNNQDKDGGFQTQSQMNDTIVISKEVSSLDNSPANNNSFRRGTFNIIKEPLSSIENSPGIVNISGVAPLHQSLNETIVISKEKPDDVKNISMDEPLNTKKKLLSVDEPIGSLENSPANNSSLRRGTFTINPSNPPKVAKVSPMVPEKPKTTALCASATSVDRRRQMGSGSVPGLRRQPGIKSTSNLKLHEKLNPPHKTAMEAPEARATPRATPSYLKPTTASSKKLNLKMSTPNNGRPKNSSNENRGISGNNGQSAKENNRPGNAISNENRGITGATPNTNSTNENSQPANTVSNENQGISGRGNRNTGAVPKQNRMRKATSSTTLKPINK